MTKPKQKAKAPPGANIEEWQRGKSRLQLRWDDDLIAAVKAAAKRDEVDAAEWLARLARQALAIV